MDKQNTVKIFVINLKRSIDRKNEIRKKLEEFDIEYEFFDAIDGSRLPPETIEKARARSDRWYHQDWGIEHSMKLGEIGAAMSHSKIYEKIVANNLPYAIILEDDIRFDYKFQQLTHLKLDVLTNHFDLILLGYCGNDLDFEKQGECSYWGRIKVNSFIKVGIPVEWCWSAIGYLVSNKGARLLLKKQGEIPTLTADLLTANSPQYGVKLGVIKSKIIWPGELNRYSTIQVDSGDYLINQESNIGFSPNKKLKEKYSIKSIFVSTIWYIRKQKIKLSRKHYRFISDRY